MANATNFFGQNTDDIETSPVLPEGLVQYSDPLTLDMDEDDLVDTVDHMIKQSRAFFKKHDLYKRRNKNVEYYLGKQIAKMEEEGKLKPYEVRYLDNIIYEGEATLKPIALSKLPDLLVKPGSNNQESVNAAKKLTSIINNDIRKRENRIVLGRAYKHRPLYFVGVIKYRWNPEVDDYVFEAVHPDNIDVDHLAPDNDVNKMRWVAHHYDLTIKEIIMRFPEKKKEFESFIKAELDINKDKDFSERGYASTVKISEVWFTWYSQVTDDATGEKKWRKDEGVLWKYKNFLFKKQKNPNWDWEGEEKLFTYKDGEKVEATEDDLRNAIEVSQTGGFETERVFNNYFSHPEKPFIFLGYDQLGMMPYDETSRIEQVLLLQDNVNKRGKQISEMADTARGKNIYSTEGGLTDSDVAEIDMRDPDTEVLVKGEINKVHRHIPGQQPSSALFEEQELSRNKAFAKMGAHGTTRGEREARETATGRQILREADYGKQDDEVTDTVNRAAERMARAALQMIKLRYTEQKLTSMVGEDGKIIFEQIQRDLVEDGMVVEAIASGVDLLRRKEEAFEMARLNLIDPLSFFEDIDASNPKVRAERLLMFTTEPSMYFENVVRDKSLNDMNSELNSEEVVEGEAAPTDETQQVMQDIATLQQGQAVTPPQNLSEGYLKAINDFINSPDFATLDPTIQQNISNYAQQLIEMVQGAGQAGQV